jgi:hypothetical protein
MARPREHGKRICAYPVEFYEEDQETVDGIEDLRAKDRLAKGPFVRKMAREYVQRHSPGNSQLILDNYHENPVPFSIAAQEKLHVEDDRHVEVDCSECSGSGENRWGGSCRGCAGIGRIGVEK